MQLIFWVLSISVITGIAACSGNQSTLADIKRGTVTDSVVVEKLISQSEKSFISNESSEILFDQFLKDAETISAKNNFSWALLRMYNLLGKRYRNRSEYLAALNYHKKALDLAIEKNIVDQLDECYNQMGVVYRRIDENSLALDMHLKAMRYAEEGRDTFNVSVSLNGIGNINIALGRYQAAIEYFKRSMAISSNKQNRLGVAINTNNIGEAFLLSGNIDTALVYFFESLEINTELNSQIGQSICFNSIGDAYIAKGDPDKALGYLLKALKITRQVGDLIYVATSLTRVGETYLSMKDYANAMLYLNEGLELSKRIGSKYQAEDAASNIALVYERQGRFKEALTYYKMRSAYKDTLINERNMYHVATLEAIFENEKQSDKIDELKKDNEIQQGKILRQKVLITSIMTGAFLVSLLLFLVSRQGKLAEKYRQLKHKQSLLRSQMNPHFIFNALSAIQVYILENDMERSSRFLSDFAKLMRQVLRNSNYEYISLQEEIDTLVYYVDLQKLRFANPFEVEVFVDLALNAAVVAIPPMLTQPFIENAIEHGLRPLGGNGRVDLRFLKRNDHLVVEVEDNGIGFAHQQSPKREGKKHDSMALNIVRERLDIIKRDTCKPVSFEIIDKKTLDPFSSGTLIRMSFPLIDKNAIKIEVDEKA